MVAESASYQSLIHEIIEIGVEDPLTRLSSIDVIPLVIAEAGGN